MENLRDISDNELQQMIHLLQQYHKYSKKVKTAQEAISDSDLIMADPALEESLENSKKQLEHFRLRLKQSQPEGVYFD